MDRWRIRELRDPEEKREAAQTVLTALPEWFGLPDSTAAYIPRLRQPAGMGGSGGGDCGRVHRPEENQRLCRRGVCNGRPSSESPPGAGRALLQTLEARARQEHMLFLQVKTVAPGRYEAYDQRGCFTRPWAFILWRFFPRCGTPGIPAWSW